MSDCKPWCGKHEASNHDSSECIVVSGIGHFCSLACISSAIEALEGMPVTEATEDAKDS